MSNNALIKIVSMRDRLSSYLGYVEIRVDRASVLGNPFELTNEADRDKVCEAYDEWLFDQINNPSNYTLSLQPWVDKGFKIATRFKGPTSKQVKNEICRLLTLLKQGNKIVLLCWCKQPNKEIRCHADSIKQLLLKLSKSLYKKGHLEYAWLHQ